MARGFEQIEMKSRYVLRKRRLDACVSLRLEVSLSALRETSKQTSSILLTVLTLHTKLPVVDLIPQRFIAKWHQVAMRTTASELLLRT